MSWAGRIAGAGMSFDCKVARLTCPALRNTLRVVIQSGTQNGVGIISKVGPLHFLLKHNNWCKFLRLACVLDNEHSATVQDSRKG
jgi:hypothetical protein